jgi:hydroxyacylglutathione hydrolase
MQMEYMVLHADAFEDNYIWLLTVAGDSSAARPALIIDPGDEIPVIAKIDESNLVPLAVLCTHHHYDHVGGAVELAERYDIPVYGPSDENISAVTKPVTDGDTLAFPDLDLEMAVIGVPGHTRGHIAYYASGILFCGDTLFSAGCGRLFEGTPEQMHDSLGRLASLPDDTAVYCAHEYTLANLGFAAAVEPDNPVLQQHISKTRAIRQKGIPSLPSHIGLEREINPFLRADQPAIQRAVATHTGHVPTDTLSVFTELRRWKDGFRG